MWRIPLGRAVVWGLTAGYAAAILYALRLAYAGVPLVSLGAS
jgi:hypothetical protein